MTETAKRELISQERLPRGMEITAPISAEFAGILTPEALRFVADLSREFEPRRQALLQNRLEVQEQIDQGRMPDFLPETKDLRESSWTISPIPQDLQDRRVEITGPVERKMMINALNSGASVFMADFEDANSPTWDNVVQGQRNLIDAVERTIAFTSPEGKEYALNPQIATLLVRPRGWHLPEKHVLIDGTRISASIFDFGLFIFHNGRRVLDHGTGPYFYLPKLEHHLEARLWNDLFVRAEESLELPRGVIKATVLIENILASFQMDEILWELREHSAGLNCGRWDYIFSIIKKFRQKPEFVLPDRALVTMTTHMMRSYSLLTIKVCHRRDAQAIGGMSAFIPVKGDPEANEAAIAQVVADKKREAGDGHDGTWVAHPGLVKVAKDVFDELMPEPNQVGRKRDDVHATAADLLQVPDGPITEGGIRTNVSVGIRYLESWLRGQGAAAINNLMEDAATAEISRAQIWQWIHNPKGVLDDGREVTEELVDGIVEEEMDGIKAGVGDDAYAGSQFALARKLFGEVAMGKDWVDFLTLVGYEYLP